MNIGKAIKLLRKNKDYKQGEFADLCGISQTYLSQIENERKDPKLKTLRKISNTTDIPLEVFLFLSISEEDVEPSKRNLFRELNPEIQDLIEKIFYEDDRNIKSA